MKHRINLKPKKFPDKVYGDYPNGKWEIMKFDDNLRIICCERSDGSWWKREYDDNEHLIHLKISDGRWAKYEYDNDGNVIYVETDSGIKLRTEQ